MIANWRARYVIWCLCCIGFLGLFLGGSQNAHAQAWTQPQGNVYIKASYGFTTAAEQFLFDGSTKAFFDGVDKGFGVFQDHSPSVYLEGGVVDFLTIFASLPYKIIFMEDNTFQHFTAAMGNLDLGLRFSIQHFAKIPKISALAVNVKVNVPLGYTRNFFPPVGLGRMELQATVNYGQSFYPVPLYLQVGVGYAGMLPFRIASQSVKCDGADVSCFSELPNDPDMAHFFVFGAELGWTPARWFLAQATFSGKISFDEPKATVSVPGTADPEKRFLEAGAALTFYPFYKVRGLQSLGLGVQFAGRLWGQAATRAIKLLFGLEYQINFKALGK